MPLFRALAKNMAPTTNADKSPYAFLTEHFSLYSIYSLTSHNVLRTKEVLNGLDFYLKYLGKIHFETVLFLLERQVLTKCFRSLGHLKTRYHK